jgi:hypothetical protein
MAVLMVLIKGNVRVRDGSGYRPVTKARAVLAYSPGCRQRHYLVLINKDK